LHGESQFPKSSDLESRLGGKAKN